MPQGHEIDNVVDHSGNEQYDGIQSHRNYANIMQWSRNDWREVIIPPALVSHHYTQTMSYMIRGLELDQQYEARIQSR